MALHPGWSRGAEYQQRQEGPPQDVVGIPGAALVHGDCRGLLMGLSSPRPHSPTPVPPLPPASGSYLALQVISLGTMQVITHILAPRCFSFFGDTSSEV